MSKLNITFFIWTWKMKKVRTCLHLIIQFLTLFYLILYFMFIMDRSKLWLCQAWEKWVTGFSTSCHSFLNYPAARLLSVCSAHVQLWWLFYANKVILCSFYWDRKKQNEPGEDSAAVWIDCIWSLGDVIIRRLNHH